MKTIVTNVLTREEFVYVNNNSLTDNIINQIIIQQKRTSSLLDSNYRKEVKERYDIREGVSMAGYPIAHCYDFNLHAQYSK